MLDRPQLLYGSERFKINCLLEILIRAGVTQSVHKQENQKHDLKQATILHRAAQLDDIVGFIWLEKQKVIHGGFTQDSNSNTSPDNPEPTRKRGCPRHRWRCLEVSSHKCLGVDSTGTILKEKEPSEVEDICLKWLLHFFWQEIWQSVSL